ncbi:MAG: PIN domain-containing protein [Vicinamibacteria bacterium]|nr:PIN domain-containing protein [Vicinamibacteria bacterium]
MTPELLHLDTIFLVRALAVGTSESRRLGEWLEQSALLGLSVIAWAEFLCGPLDDEQVELALAVVGEPVPLSANDAKLAARLFNTTGRRRGSLPDCLIAATAIRTGATLATSNPQDFKRFEANGLTLAV